MFLKNMVIKNFRCIKDITINFNEGLNILVGENNSGKSSIIDALRLCFSLGKQWRNIGIHESDFYIDKTDPTSPLEDIEFHLYFEIQNPEEAGIFIDLLSVDGTNEELQLHVKYSLNVTKGITRIKPTIWGGDNEGQHIAYEIFDLLYFVYLEPLRDAVKYLRPFRGSKLGELFSKIETDLEKQDSIAKEIRNSFRNQTDLQELILKGQKEINRHLSESAIGELREDVEIDLLPFDFRKIVDSLRIQMPIYSPKRLGTGINQAYFELYQNGLGYNNLIYTAVVLGDLLKRKGIEPESYISLLIEEPEAHLHPQMQNTFFSYMNELNKKGIQIFITSHSPTITSKADLDSLIILDKLDERVKAFSLRDSDLNEDNKKYLHKFLDVTKAQLFFAKGVILVEGISEALLLPVFSKMIDGDYDLQKKGIEIVNINGVAFEHFAKLFNSDEPNKRLDRRCVIISDDDKDDNGIAHPRATKALALEGGMLSVELADVTFEYELFITENNKEILLNIFKELHKNASKDIFEGQSLKEHAKNFLAKVKSTKAKTELAHTLAMRLENFEEVRNNFKVPQYIEESVKWVIDGK